MTTIANVCVLLPKHHDTYDVHVTAS